MTLNPPNAIAMLVSFNGATALGVGGQDLIKWVSVLIRQHYGRKSYSEFLSFWHLHLQAIPFNIARQAWGLTQTSVLP